MQNHQEFIRNLISSETPYNGALLFHGTGVGKTCAAMGVSEGLRDYVHKNGKKIYVLSSKNIRPNFYKELYDADREAVERDIHGIPGSYQCSGDRYYVEGYFKPESKARAIKERINEHYVFKGYGTFSNFVDVELGCATYNEDGMIVNHHLPEHMEEPKMTMEDGSWVDVGDYFNNSVIIIDEAHGIAGKGLKKDDDDDDSTEDSTEDPDEDQTEESTEIEKKPRGRKAKAKIGAKDKSAKKPKNISKRSLYRVLESIIKACRQKGGNIKLLLLTATPMKDKVRELGDLLELLNLNDGRELPAGWKGTLFPKDIMTYDTLSDAFSPEQERLLMTIAKGYISYVKGDNPVTFPKALLPHHDDMPDLLYEPGKRLNPLVMNPIFAYHETEDGPVDIQDYFNIKEPPEFRFNLVKCEMDPYQFVCYKELVNGGVPGAGRSSDTHPRMISNIAFPVVSGGETPYTIVEHGTDLKEILKRDENRAAVHGNKGFAYAFKDHVDIVPSTKDHASPKKYTSYSINETLWQTCGFFMMTENPVAPEYPLSMFSKKLSLFVEFVNRSPGIAYAYSEFVQSGALIAALALEANGYVRYHPDLRKYIDGNGLPKPNCRTQLPESFLFRYTPDQLAALPKNFYRCSRCGQLYDQCAQTPGHKFNLATYILVTGSDGGIKEIAEATTDNQTGDKVKVVVGTKVTGQGVDFKWIRQVHIIDPWHNNTVIFQAIGRGIRHCSHADIPPDQRNVMIYKYSSTTDVSAIIDDGIDVYDDEILDAQVTENTDPDDPDTTVTFNYTYRDLLTETVDEHMYRRVVRKDLIIKLIERVLKRIAIDCELNRVRNIFPTDEDYSRACDYMLCQYKCEDFKDPIEYVRRIRRSEDDEYQYWYEHGGKMELRNAGGADDTTISELIDVTEIAGRTNAEMWDHYASNRMTIREDDFEEVMVDEPLGRTIDESTYDIYFSEPQIDKAIKIISRIFQKTQALRLNKITYLVKKMDPLIEEKFVYIALDKIVGRPPYVKAMTLVDKFGRNGTLIVHNEFYIYQPHELKDPVIPMFYRSRPLSIKNSFYNMNRLSAAKVKKVIQKATDVDPQKIIDLAEKYSGDNRPLVTAVDVVLLHIELYKLLLPELQALLEHMVQLSNESNTQYVVEYCMQAGMTFFLPEPEPDDTIGSLLKECRNKKSKRYMVHIMQSINKPNTQVRIFRQGKWKPGELNALPDSQALLQGVSEEDYPQIYVPHSDLSLQYDIAQRSLLPNLNDDKDTQYLGKLGIYGMMATPAHRLQQPLFSDATILGILLSSVEAFKREYPTHISLAKCKFKVFDQNNFEEVLTKTGDVSLRGKIRGRVCSTFSKENDVHDLVQYMCNIVQENSEQMQIGDDMRGFMKSLGVNGKLNEEGQFVPIKSSKDVACNNLMRLLMLINYFAINDKKWFIGPIETNIYRPSKK